MVSEVEDVTEELYRRERAPGFTFSLPWAVGNGEVESGKKEGQPGLPRVAALGCTEIFQAFLVGPDQEWRFCSFQPVPPLFQHHLNGQDFSVA